MRNLLTCVLIVLLGFQASCRKDEKPVPTPDAAVTVSDNQSTTAPATASVASGVAPGARLLPPDPFDIVFEPLLADIWVVRRPRPERQPVMGNGLVILNGDHVVVVDANGSPLLADRVIDKIQALTPLPVRTLVVTHWHGDHNLGNHRYRATWPDLEIIGHRFTRDAMLGAPMDYLDDLRETLPDQLAGLRQMAAAGRSPDGKPLPRYMQDDFDDLVSFSDLILTELEASEVTPPDRIFDDRLILDSGPRTIEILHFGPGNTAGDAMVWLPAERILATGDVVVAPTPYGFGSYPRSWVQVLDRIRGLQPRYIVPGHGEVMEGPYYVIQLKELLTMVSDKAETAVTDGFGLGTFREHFDWEGAGFRFHQNDPVLALRWDQWFTTPILEAAHNEARGVENEPLWRPRDD